MKRSILTKTLLSLLLLVCVGLTACGSNVGQGTPQNTPEPRGMQQKTMGYNELVAQLKAAGATVVPGSHVTQPFMTVEGRTLTVNGEPLQVFEYASLQDANAQASMVSPDGTKFTTVSSSGQHGASIVDWVKPSHLYTSGRVIAIYLGTNTTVVHLLVKILGKQFAGM
jgi:hypothetical protein